MFGWRARIGVLVPPGNPTVEPEFYRMAPGGVSVHFARLASGGLAGPAGGAEGMEERMRAYVGSVPATAGTLAEVEPDVVALAHTASSYAVGVAEDPVLAERIATAAGAPAVTAAGVCGRRSSTSTSNGSPSRRPIRSRSARSAAPTGRRPDSSS